MSIEIATLRADLADATLADVATLADGSSWWLIDSSGDRAGLATWGQIQDSLGAGPEGWIEGEIFDVYVDGNVEELAAAFAAFMAA